jgi:hypothetical protein
MVEERTDGKTAIFLGAGASSVDGAPRKLICEYLLYTDEYIDSNQQLLERNERIESFVNFLFNTSICPTPDEDTCPNFEEILAVIEMAIQRKETFKGYGKGLSFVDSNSNEQDLRQIHEDLILSIAQIIALKIGVGSKHNDFVKKLRNDGDLQNIVFLTTNYDLLLDNALTRHTNRAVNFTLPDYGFNYNLGFPHQYNQSSIPYLKLHGSLNWLYCPRCIQIDLTPFYKSAFQVTYESTQCSCGQPKLPVIIPPTYLKDISNLHLIQVWNKAETELRDVERVIFCGYSLPQSDLQIRYLLKRCQINRDNPRTFNIYVINNYKEENGQRKVNEWTKSQYDKFFGARNVTYLANKFEEFVVDGLDILP